MLSHREPDKARHYLDLLDNARCNGQWQEIPELTRKVEKHSPQRQCLIITAQTERRIAESAATRLPTAGSSQGLPYLVPSLQAAIEKGTAFAEDSFQARVCLAWLYSTIGDPALTLSSLYPESDQAPEQLTQEVGFTARWTHVCIIKGAYIRGISLEMEGKSREAARAYASMLPYLSNLASTFASTPEHRSWTEKLLARHCMLSSRYVTANVAQPQDLLSPFRAFADHYERNTWRNTSQNSSHARVWQAYYDTLSVLFQQGMVQPIFKSRLHQATELRKVQVMYEAALLKEVKFPRADQSNSQVESWVDQVMANWRVMCGSGWQNHDLGEGGKANMGRVVLDILYRAATRSFHSTRVLRHLFTVHAALAEFYLASKALNSYFEILLKGQARTEKSGEIDIGLDDDATALGTAAAGIKMLCYHGRRKDVEKSLSIAKITDAWLQKLHRASSPMPFISAEDVPQELLDKPRISKPPVPGKALALGYHALGVSQSCWARLTYDTSSRSHLQSKAIVNFRTALDPYFGEEQNTEFLYSLANVLSETRDLDAAISTTKRALSSEASGLKTKGVTRTDFTTDTVEDDLDPDTDSRGLLLRCWHLLALLLSARENFTAAIACCEAALDLYGSKSILHGDLKSLDTLRDLQFSQRKNIIEVKMTHLALAEVIDGPEEAVNESGELLGLYTKLFKCSEKAAPQAKEIDATSPPAIDNGTLRSFRGSILGLPNHPDSKSRQTNLRADNNTVSSSLYSHESPDESNRPPIVTVTGDGNVPILQNPNHHSHFLGRHESNKLLKRNSRKALSSQRTSRATSPARTGTTNSARHPLHLGLPHRGRQDGPITTDGSVDTPNYNSNNYDSNEVGVAISYDLPSMPSTPAASSDPPNPLQTAPSTAENMNKRNLNTFPVAPKPPSSAQTTRLRPVATPSILLPLPEPSYSPPVANRHALTLLTKIWLLIAALYRRASMPMDAAGALSEATSHVQAIETAIAISDGSSAKAFATPEYGRLKACGELWADVLSEQAALRAMERDVEGASKAYETALGWWPDHMAATVGLSDILLDAYAKPPPTEVTSLLEGPISTPTLASLSTAPSQDIAGLLSPADLLSRLAARDRAYGLLSALTKSGAGWDCSEAWFALARAYEESGQVEKAKEALWWVVELEEGRGVRGWRNIV